MIAKANTNTKKIASDSEFMWSNAIDIPVNIYAEMIHFEQNRRDQNWLKAQSITILMHF